MNYETQIGDLVVDKAYEIFVVCGAGHDFCVQRVGAASVVFGGTNRVIFHPLRGFRVDHSHCSDRFIREFEAQHYNGRQGS